MVFQDVGFDARLPTVDKQIASYPTSPGKAIIQIKALSALNRLVILNSEGVLSVHDMWHLEPTKERLRGLTTMCLNPSPSPGQLGSSASGQVDTHSTALSAYLCVAKKKQLQLYRLSEEKLTHHKDFSVKENPIAIAMVGDAICYATSTHYYLLNVSLGSHQEVAAYSSELSPPLIKLVQGCEFLVTGPSNLGIFVSGAGAATKPPIPLGEGVSSCSYHHPYVLCINEDTIIIYSIFDREPKQKISFPGGACLDNFEGILLLCTQDIVFTLHPVPWDKQVTDLLKQKKVSEALEIAKSTHKANLTPQEQKDIIAQVKQQAGFIQLSELNFSEAGQHLEEGRADTRAVISLFSVVASEKYFVKDSFNTPTLESVCGGNPEMRKNAYQFLTSYLETNRYSVPAEQRQAVDTALVKLYALRSQAAEDSDILTAKLLEMIEAQDTVCDIQECADFLADRLGKHHYKALLYYSQGLRERALEIWERLVDGRLSDATLENPIGLMVDMLKREEDTSLVIRFVKCILDSNQSSGVRVFVERSQAIDDETVLSTLLNYPVATMEYLEHLVLDRRTTDPAYHTQLATIYLSYVLESSKNGRTTPRDYRRKLQTFLRMSAFYQPDKLLDLCTANALHLERAILYERLDRHEETLKVYVHELGDFAAAKEFCHRISNIRLDHDLKCGVYGTLLSILMNPPPNCDSAPLYLKEAVALLNDDEAEFNVDEVLRIVPIDWQVTSLADFVIRGLRNAHHRLGMLHIRVALTKLENMRAHQKRIQTQSTHFLVRENRVCNACNRPLLTPSFVRYPDGSIVHMHCAKAHKTVQHSYT
ncbi:transforming growth factor-beta receptor-associated protein 1-like isoform X2 [Varroa destructor]|nr:transforming growth factor-beta receptor-associated protein 1-like isoform X2 [Varroa destructor]